MQSIASTEEAHHGQDHHRALLQKPVLCQQQFCASVHGVCVCVCVCVCVFASLSISLYLSLHIYICLSVSLSISLYLSLSLSISLYLSLYIYINLSLSLCLSLSLSLSISLYLSLSLSPLLPPSLPLCLFILGWFGGRVGRLRSYDALLATLRGGKPQHFITNNTDLIVQVCLLGSFTALYQHAWGLGRQVKSSGEWRPRTHNI